ncbi:MAG: biotin/lipoyl-containing protein [Microthrixaceae bacterium]
MADIVMTQLGESVTEGTITRWFKAVGDTVVEDEPLYEVSTDKVDTEVPAPQSGTLDQILVQEGDTVDVGTVLAVIGDGSAAPASTAAAETPAAEAAPTPAAPTPEPAPIAAAPEPAPVSPVPTPPPAPTPPTPVQPAAAPAPAAASEPVAEGRLLSPLVRKLVEEHQLDVTTIEGSGVGGRITREDVLDAIDARNGGAHAASTAAPAASTAAPVSAAPAPAAPTAPPAFTPPAPPSAPAATAPRHAPTVPTIVPGSGDTVEQLNKIRLLTGQAMVSSMQAAPTRSQSSKSITKQSRRFAGQFERISSGRRASRSPICRSSRVR